jgi:hypothetical protein
LGIFVEELRHGRSQAESFRDVFELAERADSWGETLDILRQASPSSRPRA